MSRVPARQRCSACGATAARWVGRCPSCGAWNTLGPDHAPAGGRPGPVPIGQVAAGEAAPVATGLAEFDRVLGGGLVPGSVTLLAGEPGTGKSTLLLQVLGALARSGHPGLLVAAEEAPHQVRLRAERLEILSADLMVVADDDVAAVVASAETLGPGILVVDSIQAVRDAGVEGTAGSVAQVRACTARLVRMAKQRALTTVLVGHVTKEGGLAGPRALEHAVDTVVSFEGDRHNALRTLRAVKHRFGTTAELGLFEMTEGGLEPVADAGHLFLADRRPGLPGSAVAAVLDGRRPLLVEVQALVGPPGGPRGGAPRRSVSGLDAGRLALLLAVLERRAGVRTSGSDVFATATGGVRVRDPGADLALSLAVASSATGVPLAPGVVACGEVGLGGELRTVPSLGRRLGEAARVGFTTAVVPASAPAPPPGLATVRVGSLAEALVRLGLRPGRPAAVVAR